MMRPLARNTLWMFTGQSLGYGVRLIYFVLLARLLGVRQYGVIVGALSFVSLVAPYCQLGMGTLLLRYVSADHSRFGALWGNFLLFTAAANGVVTLCVVVAAPYFLDGASAGLVLLAALSLCLCEQVVVGATQAFQAFQEMRYAAILNQLTAVLRLIAVFGMWVVLQHASAKEWCLALACSSGLAALTAVVVITRRFGRPQFTFRLFLSTSREGMEYAFASSTSSAYNDLDKTLLSHYEMDAANGIYSMAYRIIDLATTPITSIQMAGEPCLFQLAANKIENAVRLGKSLLRRAMLVSGMTALLLYISAPGIPLVLGDRFAEGVSALRWLCLLPIFRSIHGIAGSTLTCAGWQRYRTVAQVAAVGVNLGLNLWLIPKCSWHGAAYASLATDGLLAGINVLGLYLLDREYGVRTIAATPLEANVPEPRAVIT